MPTIFRQLDRFPPRRAGMTLVELLVVMGIISMLASLAMGGLFVARASARQKNSAAMVNTLGQAVSSFYDSYRTRRVPVERQPNESIKTFSAKRLERLRMMMRMDMPDRWEQDVVNIESALSQINSRDPQSPPLTRSALSLAYKRYYDRIKPDNDNQRAECLYMIVTLALGEEGQLVSRQNVGDIDKDGANEFHDAWGNPIRFIRYPVGFRSDLQSGDVSTDPDPFNPHKVDLQEPVYRKFAVHPLVYSIGPDGESDVLDGNNDNNEPGKEEDKDNDGVEYLDNIYSHNVATK